VWRHGCHVVEAGPMYRSYRYGNGIIRHLSSQKLFQNLASLPRDRNLRRRVVVRMADLVFFFCLLSFVLFTFCILSPPPPRAAFVHPCYKVHACVYLLADLLTGTYSCNCWSSAWTNKEARLLYPHSRTKSLLHSSTQSTKLCMTRLI